MAKLTTRTGPRTRVSSKVAKSYNIPEIVEVEPEIKDKNKKCINCKSFMLRDTVKKEGYCNQTKSKNDFVKWNFICGYFKNRVPKENSSRLKIVKRC